MQVMAGLQAQLQDLQRNEALRAQGAKPSDLKLFPEIRDAIPPHLQLDPDAAARKRIVANYPKPDHLPAVLADSNGLASKMLGDSKERKYLLTVLPGVQRDALECTRVAASAWQLAQSMQDPAARADYLLKAVRDLAVLSVDTAQRAADSQIKGIIEAAGHKGALTFVRTSPKGDVDIDLGDHNIIQACHVDAVKEMSGFAKDIKTNSRNGGSCQNRSQGRGNGGRGGGRGGSSYGNWRSQGNGRGRGRGSNNYNRGNNSNNRDSNRDNNRDNSQSDK